MSCCRSWYMRRSPCAKLRPGGERRVWSWLAAFSWVWILVCAIRAGGDQWDNPRYRLIFFGIAGCRGGVCLARLAGTSGLMAAADPGSRNLVRAGLWPVVSGALLSDRHPLSDHGGPELVRRRRAGNSGRRGSVGRVVGSAARVRDRIGSAKAIGITGYNRKPSESGPRDMPAAAEIGQRRLQCRQLLSRASPARMARTWPSCCSQRGIAWWEWHGARARSRMSAFSTCWTISSWCRAILPTKALCYRCSRNTSRRRSTTWPRSHSCRRRGISRPSQGMSRRWA